MAHNEGGCLPTTDDGQPRGRYEAPELILLGAVAELTSGCDKKYGDSDGYTFMGSPITCTSV